LSTTPTTNLNLITNNADEPIANWRTNDNANMNALDTAIKAVQDATDTLEKARQNLNNLIGVLGKNSSNADLISKAQARANLDVAQSGGAAKTLYADEQTIAQNASLIASLQDSAFRFVADASGDYDDYKDAGYYNVNNSMTANKPTETGNTTGILVVFTKVNRSGVVTLAFQQYWATSSKAFFRIFGLGSNPQWTPWRQLTTV